MPSAPSGWAAAGAVVVVVALLGVALVVVALVVVVADVELPLDAPPQAVSSRMAASSKAVRIGAER
jgi:hypothetical protein